ncbi:MAG: hypothetical protein ABIG28_02255 [archaeon]
MKKVLGYILAIAGLIGLASSVIGFEIPFFTELGSTILLIISLGLIVVGILFVMKGGGRRGKQAAEVPIYHGKNVVGYRRH